MPQAPSIPSSPRTPGFYPSVRLALGLMLIVVLFYGVRLAEVVNQARLAPSQSSQQGTIVVLGKRVNAGQLDADFLARITRAQSLLQMQPHRELVLSGGGVDGPSEAQLALEVLKKGLGMGVLPPSSWRLESASRDTHENLINTQQMLLDPVHTVSIVTSRYHLARVNRLAHNAGMSVELIGAEDVLPMNASSVASLLREAAYVSWLDVSSW